MEGDTFEDAFKSGHVTDCRVPRSRGSFHFLIRNCGNFWFIGMDWRSPARSAEYRCSIASEQYWRNDGVAYSTESSSAPQATTVVGRIAMTGCTSIGMAKYCA